MLRKVLLSFILVPVLTTEPSSSVPSSRGFSHVDSLLVLLTSGWLTVDDIFLFLCLKAARYQPHRIHRIGRLRSITQDRSRSIYHFHRRFWEPCLLKVSASRLVLWANDIGVPDMRPLVKQVTDYNHMTMTSCWFRFLPIGLQKLYTSVFTTEPDFVILTDDNFIARFPSVEIPGPSILLLRNRPYITAHNHFLGYLVHEKLKVHIMYDLEHSCAASMNRGDEIEDFVYGTDLLFIPELKVARGPIVNKYGRVERSFRNLLSSDSHMSIWWPLEAESIVIPIGTILGIHGDRRYHLTDVVNFDVVNADQLKHFYDSSSFSIAMGLLSRGTDIASSSSMLTNQVSMNSLKGCLITLMVV